MRYTDNVLTTPGYNPPQRSTYPERLQPPTNEDIITHLIRIETRLVKLMYHVGLDANGHVREEA